MKCIKCNQDIEPGAPANVKICGSCADGLRQEEEAATMAAQAESEHIVFETNKEAYEETLREEQFDGGLNRYW